jgi:murein L,D-transpeptidase YcbB/YkuD
LITGQPFLPKNLPKQQLFQMENGLHKSTHQLSQLVATAEITPPEFIYTDETFQVALSALSLEKDKILQKIRKKNLSQSFSIADAEPVQATDKDSAKVATQSQKFNRQPLPILRFASSGIVVRVLQRLLISNGYMVRVDGVFGPLTETAVQAFQNRRNLVADGIVGQITWRELTSK